MKAITYAVPGGADVLQWTDVPEPACSDDGMILRVAASAIEGGDLVQRRSMRPSGSGPVLGYAAAGVIEAIGRSVTEFVVGQRVVTVTMRGAHAELVACEPSTTWPLPDGLDLVTAATIPIAYGTAYCCLERAGGVGRGDTVFIQGGAGGLGTALVQLASHAGARVLATVSGDERTAALRKLGLDGAIDHRTEDVVQTVRRLTGGALADVVIDPIGGSTLASSLACLRPFGALVFVGNAGGKSLDVDLWPALQSNQTLHGVFAGPEFPKPSVHAEICRMIAMIADGDMSVVIDRTFEFAAASAAHRHMEARSGFGRIVLINPAIAAVGKMQ